jgi:cell division protein FtsW
MCCLLALICIGILMVYSASVSTSYLYYGTPYYVFQRELLWVVLGVVALIVTSQLDYRRLEAVALPLLGCVVMLLAAVLAPHIGHISHGARRWFSLGAGITLEPSELVKLALVIYLAAWLSAKGALVKDFRATFIPFSILVGLIFALIIKQPDLGTATVVAIISMTVFFLAGADLVQLGAVLAGSAGVAWSLAQASSYQGKRITIFLDPWKYATGAGYHTVQALLALGSGGIVGKGLGNSIQKNVLPAPHTDSILAVIGEEFGLIGTVGILLLFVIFAYRGMRVATHAPDGFGRLLAGGITSWITFQALLNFAVITSSVPFTGVPLPFVSYGGTSFIITMAATGILLSVSRHAVAEGDDGRLQVGTQDTHDGGRNRRPRISRMVDHPVPLSADPHPWRPEQRSLRHREGTPSLRDRLSGKGIAQR